MQEDNNTIVTKDKVNLVVCEVSLDNGKNSDYIFFETNLSVKQIEVLITQGVIEQLKKFNNKTVTIASRCYSLDSLINNELQNKIDKCKSLEAYNEIMSSFGNGNLYNLSFYPFEDFLRNKVTNFYLTEELVSPTVAEVLFKNLMDHPELDLRDLVNAEDEAVKLTSKIVVDSYKQLDLDGDVAKVGKALLS